MSVRFRSPVARVVFASLLAVACSLFAWRIPARSQTESGAGRDSGAWIRGLIAGELDPLTFDFCAWRFDLAGGARDLHHVMTVLGEDQTQAEQEGSLRASLTRAGATIALDAHSRRSCRRSFRWARKHHEAAVDKAIATMWKRGSVVYARDPEIARVQDLVVELWVQDQAARQVAREGGTGFHRRVPSRAVPACERSLAEALAHSAEDHSVSVLKGLLAHYGWIDRARFGEEVSDRAVNLVQRADDHPEFQRTVLERMGKHLESGGVRRQDYARLWDQVAVNQGRLQRYGTQFDRHCGDDGTLDLQPVEEPARLDEQRAVMGLGPVQTELEEMSRAACRQHVAGGPRGATAHRER